MATQPSLRIGDRERDAVAAELQEHYARGRLTLEEFNQRIDAVFAAKTQGDLSRITADLPHVPSGGAPLPSSRRSPRLASGPPTMGWTGAADAQALAAGATGWSGGYRYSGRRPGRGFAAVATLLAALASWLLVYDVLLVGLKIPWPGQLGLLIAIFGFIRGLLRRIFRFLRARR
jgi:Domain of unknown function (DUF1707)